jgi:hypothetical protein
MEILHVEMRFTKLHYHSFSSSRAAETLILQLTLTAEFLFERMPAKDQDKRVLILLNLSPKWSKLQIKIVYCHMSYF